MIIYLKFYGFNNIQKEIIKENIIDALKEEYYDWSDLIAAGLHSEKVLFKFRIGDVSNYLIEKAKNRCYLVHRTDMSFISSINSKQVRKSY